MTTTPAVGRAFAFVRRHGWNATSFQVLDPGFRYWFATNTNADDEHGGAVAYVDTGRAWVVAGAPLCAVARMHDVATAFAREAHAQHRRVCFFGVEQRFLDVTGWRGRVMGEQGVWDPAQWAHTVAHRRTLRAQLRRAHNHGVTVHALDAATLAHDVTTRDAITALLHAHAQRRRLLPMGFLARVSLDRFTHERRMFVARCHGVLVGLLSAVPVYAREGWLVDDILRDPHAPNGTTEALVDAAMTTFLQLGARWATLGMAPLAGDVERWAKVARRVGRPLFDFEGLAAFKRKFGPARTEPLFLAAPPRDGGWRSVMDVLTAFADGGLAGFGARSLLRTSRLALRSPHDAKH